MREIDAKEADALRACATICWLRRNDLGLDDAMIEKVLVSWMAIGLPEEATAAAEVLAARREQDRKQQNFDRLLGQ